MNGDTWPQESPVPLDPVLLHTFLSFSPSTESHFDSLTLQTKRNTYTWGKSNEYGGDREHNGTLPRHVLTLPHSSQQKQTPQLWHLCRQRQQAHFENITMEQPNKSLDSTPSTTPLKHCTPVTNNCTTREQKRGVTWRELKLTSWLTQSCMSLVVL